MRPWRPRTPDGWRGRIQDWVGILLCMATARSAAMAFNRLVDRDYDALNPRTAGRHLPAGKLSVRSVALFTAACALGFIASTLLFLPNRWPLLLSVPVLRLAARLLLHQAIHQPGPLLAGCLAQPGPGRGLDRAAGAIAWPPVLAGAGRALLGRRVRHHLCLPGRRLRPAGGPARASPIGWASRGPPSGGCSVMHS